MEGWGSFSILDLAPWGINQGQDALQYDPVECPGK